MGVVSMLPALQASTLLWRTLDKRFGQEHFHCLHQDLTLFLSRQLLLCGDSVLLLAALPKVAVSPLVAVSFQTLPLLLMAVSLWSIQVFLQSFCPLRILPQEVVAMCAGCEWLGVVPRLQS